MQNLEVSDHYVTVVEGQNKVGIVQVNTFPSDKLIDGHICIYKKNKKNILGKTLIYVFEDEW